MYVPTIYSKYLNNIKTSLHAHTILFYIEEVYYYYGGSNDKRYVFIKFTKQSTKYRNRSNF